MKILTAQQVQEKMKKGSNVQLVMTLGPKQFAMSHIPDSVNIWDIEKAKELLSKEAEIIVYCSDIRCMASYAAYEFLKKAGYQNVWRFAGGLLEWSEAGYPLAALR